MQCSRCIRPDPRVALSRKLVMGNKILQGKEGDVNLNQAEEIGSNYAKIEVNEREEYRHI